VLKHPHDRACGGGGGEGGTHLRALREADSTLPGGQPKPAPEQARAPARLAVALKESTGWMASSACEPQRRDAWAHFARHLLRRHVAVIQLSRYRRYTRYDALRGTQPSSQFQMSRVPHSCH
jgi:hypothetical protein